MAKKNLTYSSKAESLPEQTPASASAEEEEASQKDAEGSTERKEAEPSSSEASNKGVGGVYKYIGGGRRVKV